MIPGVENDVHLHETPAVLYSVALLLLGGQFMSIGFVAELFIAYHDPDIKAYSVSERTDQAQAGPKRPHFTPRKAPDQ